MPVGRGGRPTHCPPPWIRHCELSSGCTIKIFEHNSSCDHKSVEQFAGWLSKRRVVILPVQAVAEDVFISTVRPRRIVNFTFLTEPCRNICTYLFTYMLVCSIGETHYKNKPTSVILRARNRNWPSQLQDGFHRKHKLYVMRKSFPRLGGWPGAQR